LVVLVDLIHDHPAVLQGNLLIAKYLAILTRTSWGSYRIGERIAGQIVAFVTAHIDDSTYRLLCRRALRDDGVIA